jgi:hypothetical protein
MLKDEGFEFLKRMHRSPQVIHRQAAFLSEAFWCHKVGPASCADLTSADPTFVKYCLQEGVGQSQGKPKLLSQLALIDALIAINSLEE